MPLNTEVDYNHVVIKGTVELGVKGERGLQGFKGDQGPPVPVAHELGDDPYLAVSQKLLTDSIADMEQSNEAAVTEATHQAGLAGDSAGIAASRAGESEQSAQTAGQYASTATEQAGIATTKAREASDSEVEATRQAGLASDSAGAAEQSATIATTKADEAVISAGEAEQSAQASAQSALDARDLLDVVMERLGNVEYELFIRTLFMSGEKGFWVDPSDTYTLFQNSEGTISVTANGDPIGLVLDKTGNNYNLTQTVSASRPKLLDGGIVFDNVDDALKLDIPEGGFTGTLFLATTRGTASYGVSMPAGVWTLGNAYSPRGDVVSAVLVDRVLSGDEKARLHVFGIGKGGFGFGVVTSLNDAFRLWVHLVDFPLIDISSVNSFVRAWLGCINLESFPDNFFDNCTSTNFSAAFNNTNLSQASIDGILVSINSNDRSNGTFNQSGGSAPSAVGQAAIDAMRSRGWTVSTTGGY